ncbi:MAG: hypothetical protein ABMB14_31975, partial [Myxococcota bacterium]
MTDAAVALAIGCVLQIADARLTFDAGDVNAAADRPARWIEATHLEVAADPTCPWIELSVPPGAALGDHRARQRLGDGTHTRLGEERWEVLPRSIDGGGAVRLHTPELLSGDRVVIDVVRELPPGTVRWRPGAA